MGKTASMSQTHLFPEEQGYRPEPVVGQRYTRGQASIHFDRAENLYADWPTPTCIISDGPYGDHSRILRRRRGKVGRLNNYLDLASVF